MTRPGNRQSEDEILLFVGLTPPKTMAITTYGVDCYHALLAADVCARGLAFQSGRVVDRMGKRSRHGKTLLRGGFEVDPAFSYEAACLARLAACETGQFENVRGRLPGTLALHDDYPTCIHNPGPACSIKCGRP